MAAHVIAITGNAFASQGAHRCRYGRPGARFVAPIARTCVLDFRFGDNTWFNAGEMPGSGTTDGEETS